MLKTKKRFNLFLTVIIAFSMLFGSFQSIAFAEAETSIENVFNQKWHDASQPVSITAMSNQNLTEADLGVTVGGKALTSVSCKASAVRGAGCYVISGTLPSDAVLGANELKLLVDGQAVASADIYLTSYVNTVAGDTLNEITFDDESELSKLNGYFNDTEGVLLNGEYVFENKPHDNLPNYGKHALCFWADYANRYAAAPDAENLYFDASFQQSGDELGVSVYTKTDGSVNRIKFYGPTGADWGYHLKIMGSNGAYGEMIETEFPVSKTTFRLRIDKNKETYEVYANKGNGEEKLFGGNCSFVYGGVESKRFDLYALRVSAPGKVAIDNIRVVKINKFPEVGAVYYNNGGVATKLEGASVPMSADSFTIGLDKAVANVSSSTVILKKIGGSVLSGTTASFDSTNKTITLALGDNKLEAGAKYSIVLSKDITYSSEAYDANTEISFTVAQPDFALITPADGASIKLGDNLTISGTAPVGTTVTASIGSISDNFVVNDGTYNINIPTSSLSLGELELSVSDGSKTIRKKIIIGNEIVKNYFNFESFTSENGNYSNSNGGYKYILSTKDSSGYVRADESGDVLIMQFDPSKSTSTDLTSAWGGCGGYRLINNDNKIPYEGRIVRTSFDIKFPTSNGRLSMIAVTGWASALMTSVDAGQWYTVVVEEDYTTVPAGAIGTMNIYVYRKGETTPFKKTTPSNIPSSKKTGTYDDFYIYPYRSQSITQAEKDAGVPVTICYIDNLNAVSYESIPSITAATYNAGSDIAIDKLVPATATNIKLTLDSQGIQADTATADNIKLYVNGTDAQAEVSYDADTKVITINTTGKLNEYDDAKIVIGSAVKTGVSGNDIGNNIEYRFKVADNNMHYFKLNKNGTETEFVVINGNETALVGTAFLASYEDAQFSELSQVISDSINLAKGASYITTMVASKANNKAMIWSADLTPYVKSK